MTYQATQAFLARMVREPAFRDRVLAVEDPAGRLALVREEGYDCTADELAEYERLLADDQLEAAVGGEKLPPLVPYEFLE